MGQGPRTQPKDKLHKANEVVKLLMCVSVVSRLPWIRGNADNKTKQTLTHVQTKLVGKFPVHASLSLLLPGSFYGIKPLSRHKKNNTDQCPPQNDVCVSLPLQQKVKR